MIKNWHASFLFVSFGLATLVSCGSVEQTKEESVLENNALTWPALERPSFTERADEKTIAALVSSMTLEQKVGQMIQGEIRAVTPEDVKKYHLGSILNGGGAFPGNEKYSKVADWVALADAFNAASMSDEKGRMPIPLIWGTDAVHGHNNVIGATIFPHNIAIGATRNLALAEAIAEATAREVAATGIDWTFAPTLAVSRDIRWGRSYESFSQDVDIVSNFSAAFVKGFQGTGENFLNDQRVLASAKHFIADGATHRGDDQGNALLSDEALRFEHAPPYFDAIEAGVQTVMVSYSSLNGTKMHGHKYLITEVLKGKLGFDGFVISDWNGIGQVPGCANDSCPQAVNAGVDMLMVPEKKDLVNIFNNMLAQVTSGEIAMARVDDAVTRILRVKMRAGLLAKDGDKVRAKPSARSLAGNADIVGSPAHRALARQAVRESLVLFKNDRSVLPISRQAKVFVGGSAADSLSKQTGGWTISWQGTENTNDDFPGATTARAAIEKVLADKSRLTSSFNAKDAAGHDVAIVIFGEPPYSEYRGDIQNLNTIDFTDKMADDLALINELKRMNIPTVAILYSGRPLWLNPVIESVDAFVAAWLPGTEGDGITDVIFKNQNGIVEHDFRGRLSFQWPLSKCHNAYDKRLPKPSTKALAIGFGMSYQNGNNDIASRMASNSGEECEDSTGSADEKKISLPFSKENGWQRVGQLFSGRNVPISYKQKGAQSVAGLTVTQSAKSTQLKWDGKGKAKFALVSDTAVNLTPYLREGYALSLKLKVDEAPTGDVLLGMECGAPCMGELNVTKDLSMLDRKAWSTVHVDLSCFDKLAVDMNKISTIATLSSDERVAITLGEVDLVPAKQADSELSCR